MSRVTLSVPMSIAGLKELQRNIKQIETSSNKVAKNFVDYSTTYIKNQANEHLRERYSDEFWYIRTGLLEKTWIIESMQNGNTTIGNIQNYSPYSGYVEFGTGMQGLSHPHPMEDELGYQYAVGEKINVNGYWVFNYQNQKIATDGQIGKWFLYSSYYDDFIVGKQKDKLFDRAFMNVHRKWTR